MPIYEFKCRDCGRLSSIFVRTVHAEYQAACKHCGGANLDRAVSRFAYHKTAQQIVEEYGVPEPGSPPEAYKDPRQIGHWVERKFEEYGMELPEEARTMIDAAREGEFPDPVKDL
ncbi:MAG TPA: zinc ribbon domain-containing protein [Dehalococcoidia bacterium]